MEFKKEICIVILFFGVMGIVAISVSHIAEQNNTKFWDEKRLEAIEYNTNIVYNFKTLTDCTEMTLQISELRFYNNTFKDQVWNHYRGLC